MAEMRTEAGMLSGTDAGSCFFLRLFLYIPLILCYFINV